MSIAFDTSTLVAGSGVLVLIVGYFLRKVDVKVDRTSAAVSALGADIQVFKVEVKNQISEVREDIKEDMVTVFNTTCHERQGACSILQETKMKAAEARASHICAKIARLEAERKDDWRLQRGWNERVEDKLNKKEGGHL